MNHFSKIQNRRRTPLFIVAWLCIALLSHAANVSIQKVVTEPKTKNEDPQTFYRIAVEQKVFKCAMLGDWLPATDLNGWHFGFISRKHNGYLAARIETFTDAEGKNIPHFTQELLEAQLKKLKPEGPRYEGTPPELKEPSPEVQIEFTRIQDKSTFQCRYQLCIRGDQLWIFACEAPPKEFADTLGKFQTFFGTFCLPEL